MHTANRDGALDHPRQTSAHHLPNLSATARPVYSPDYHDRSRGVNHVYGWCGGIAPA